MSIVEKLEKFLMLLRSCKTISDLNNINSEATFETLITAVGEQGEMASMVAYTLCSDFWGEYIRISEDISVTHDIFPFIQDLSFSLHEYLDDSLEEHVYFVSTQFEHILSCDLNQAFSNSFSDKVTHVLEHASSFIELESIKQRFGDHILVSRVRSLVKRLGIIELLRQDPFNYAEFNTAINDSFKLFSGAQMNNIAVHLYNREAFEQVNTVVSLLLYDNVFKMYVDSNVRTATLLRLKANALFELKRFMDASAVINESLQLLPHGAGIHLMLKIEAYTDAALTVSGVKQLYDMNEDGLVDDIFNILHKCKRYGALKAAAGAALDAVDRPQTKQKLRCWLALCLLEALLQGFNKVSTDDLGAIYDGACQHLAQVEGEIDHPVLNSIASVLNHEYIDEFNEAAEQLAGFGEVFCADERRSAFTYRRCYTLLERGEVHRAKEILQKSPHALLEFKLACRVGDTKWCTAAFERAICGVKESSDSFWSRSKETYNKPVLSILNSLGEPVRRTSSVTGPDSVADSLFFCANEAQASNMIGVFSDCLIAALAMDLPRDTNSSVVENILDVCGEWDKQRLIHIMLYVLERLWSGGIELSHETAYNCAAQCWNTSISVDEYSDELTLLTIAFSCMCNMPIHQAYIKAAMSHPGSSFVAQACKLSGIGVLTSTELNETELSEAPLHMRVFFILSNPELGIAINDWVVWDADIAEFSCHVIVHMVRNQKLKNIKYLETIIKIIAENVSDTGSVKGLVAELWNKGAHLFEMSYGPLSLEYMRLSLELATAFDVMGAMRKHLQDTYFSLIA
ncbi:hypothetical protein PCE1_002075 [Barthelona sp. PCE]